MRQWQLIALPCASWHAPVWVTPWPLVYVVSPWYVLPLAPVTVVAREPEALPSVPRA